MRTISVVICAYTAERWDALSAAVGSIEAQTLPPHEIVLVIDHNPALLDRSRKRWPQLQVLANSGTRGLSDARNVGVRACTSDVVAFLDDDAVADATWLETLASRYDDSDVVAVGGAVEPHWQAGRPRWFPPEFDWVVGCAHSGMPVELSPVRNVIGAGMSIRRDVLEAVGGFRTQLGRVGTIPVGCEETDLCIRAQSRSPGATVLYDPAAVVVHEVPAARASSRYYLSRCLAEGRSKATLARMVGAQDALSSEQAYVRMTLRAGVGRGLRDALAGEVGGLARAIAIVLGLLATATGYAIGTVGGAFGVRRRSRRRESDADAGPLRILMVTPRFPPDLGGVERHVQEVSRRLVRLGCDVTVLCTDRDGSRARRTELDGVHIHRVRAWPSSRDYYFAPGLWRAMGRGSWDVVHVQSYHTMVAPLAMCRSRALRVPFVVTFHGGGHSSRVRHSMRGLQRHLLAPLVRGAARVVAIARFEVTEYSRDFGIPAERFAYIPNGVDVAATRSSGPSGAAPVIASIGRLERYKGHHRVLEAMPFVLRARPDASLWIVGTGPEEDELRRRANELGIGDRVCVRSVPSGDADAMATLLGETSVVACLSSFETQPIAALEAIAAGRRVVVADNSGLRELAEDGLARAIPSDSGAASIAEAILTELDREPPARPVELPSWDDCAAQLFDLYKSVACAS